MVCYIIQRKTDIFTIQGRYTEALLLFKSSPDATWQAATLEGLATVSIIEAWSAGHALVSQIRYVWKEFLIISIEFSSCNERPLDGSVGETEPGNGFVC